MSKQRKLRAEKRAKNENPINFTCGVCSRVNKYTEDYICPDLKEEEKEEDEK